MDNNLKDRIIGDFKDNNNFDQYKLIKRYENYIERTFEIFKTSLNKINSIHSLLKLKINAKLIDLINNYPLNLENLEVDYISNVIDEELDQFKNSIKNYYKIGNEIKLDENMMNNNQLTNIVNVNNNNIINNLSNRNNNLDNKNYKDKKSNMDINYINDMSNMEKDKISNINKFQLNEYKNKINLIYFSEFDYYANIFGEKFVENNEDNIELVINNKQNSLVKNYILKKGENHITLIIKKKLINLSYMFYECSSLKNIEELKYLDVKNVNDFSYMFENCPRLLDIKPLENWDVSNGNNFSQMFSHCSLLSDLKPLQNWKVSNGNNFWCMFEYCSLLSDIKPLETWNVSNCINFSGMFSHCFSLSDIRPLEKWKVSSGAEFLYMFSNCSSLSDIKPLENWKISKKKLKDVNNNQIKKFKFYDYY